MIDNNDAGTFTLNMTENGRPNPNAGKQYGKKMFNTSETAIQIGPDRSRDAGEVRLTNGKFENVGGHRTAMSANGTYTLNMEARKGIKPGAHYGPNDRVSCKGTQVTAKVAANMGLLVSDGMGGYTAPFDNAGGLNTPASRQKQIDLSRPAYIPEQYAHKYQQQEQQALPVDTRTTTETVGMESLGDEVEQQFTHAITSISPVSSHQTLLELSRGEGFTEGMIERLSNESGLSIEQTKAVASDLYSKFEVQARQSIEGMGLDSDDLFTWAWENQPEMMQQAMQRHGAERTTKGYQEVAKAYLMELPNTDPDAILEAQLGKGITAVKEGNKIILHTPRGPFEWKSAMRAGLFKVSRRK